jgi:hypothetical protein
MNKLVWFLAPFALAIAGAIFTAWGLSTLFSKVEEKSTNMSVTAVPTSKEKWVNFNDGYPVESQGFTYTTKRRRSSTETKMSYFPVCEMLTALKWEKENNRPTGKVLIVEMNETEFNKYTNTDTLTIEGTKAAASSLPSKVQEKLKEIGLNLADVTVIESGEHPLQRGEAGTMAGLGALGAVGGSLWAFLRLRGAGSR